MKTKIYATPAVEVVTVNLKNHILDISIPVGTGGGPGGGGQTRRGIFDDEDMPNNESASSFGSNLWEE